MTTKARAEVIFERAWARGRTAACERRFRVPKGFSFIQTVGFKVGIADFFIDRENVINNIADYRLVKKRRK